MRNVHLAIIGWIGALLLGVGSWPALAQDSTTYLSLVMPTTALTTGQDYEVSIQIENVPELWLANVEIQYDPKMIYVYGTQSGSPVEMGPFFTSGSSIQVRNVIQSGQVIYSASQLAPAELLHGSGIIGTFHIYPLAPGATTLSFQQADLFTLTYTGEGEARTSTGSSPVQFTAIRLDLAITGDPVEPPSENTSTPEPTATPENFGVAVPSREPTLENVTRAPGSDNATGMELPPTPVFLTPPELEDDESTLSALLPLLIVLAVLVVAGLVFLLVVRSRSARK